MKVYRKVVKYEEYEEREKYVFNTYIIQINYWNETDEIDFMKSADHKMITRFSSIDAKLLSNNLKELKSDCINLSVKEFWDKYQNKLTGIWYGDEKVIF